MRKKIIFMLLILFGTICGAQNQKTDSLNKVIALETNDTSKSGLYILLAREYRTANPEKAIEYLKESIELAKKGGNKRLEANAFLNIGNVFFSKSNFQSAIDNYTLALTLFEEIKIFPDVARSYVNIGVSYERMGSFDISNEKYSEALKIRIQTKDKKEQANCYNYLANNFYRKGDYTKAFESYLQSLKIREDINDKIGIANCLVGIGIVLKQQNELEQSLTYYTKGLKVYEEINDENGIAMALNNIGTIQSSLKKYNEATITHKRALAIRQKINDQIGIGFSLYNIGNCYLYLGKYDEALNYHIKSLTLRQSLKVKLDISNSFYELGEVNEKKGNFDLALDYYNQSLALSKEIGYEEGIRTAYHGLSSVYKEKKNVAKAFEFYKLFTAEKDSTLNLDNKKIIAELQTKYETEKKEQEIALLNKEKNLQSLQLREKELQIRQSRIIQWSFGGGFLLLAVMGYLFYNRYKLQQQTKLEQEKVRMKKEQIDAVISAQEDERKRFAQELHDGIGSMMAVLKMNMSQLEPNDKPEKISMYKSTINLMDETYAELRNVSHNLMPQALINRGLIDALYDFKERVNKSGNMNIMLETISMSDRLKPEIEVSLYRIIQEIITNIIKYSGAQQTNIQLINHEQYLSLVIEDDGNGFDPASTIFTKGNGWHNIRSRIDFIKGNIDIDSQLKRKGTTIIIDVPIAA